jgi:phenylpropionate dioxygenase-like ring-hydroxylating dioxygenase large terminal subunit
MPPAPDLNPSDLDSGRFVAIFPNVLLAVLPNHAFVMILDPVAPGLTRETCTWTLPVGSAAPDEAFAATRSFWLEINNEDIDIVSRAQRGMDAGGYTPGRLSPRFEEPLHRFHNMVADRMVGVARIPDGDASDTADLYGSGVNPNPPVLR